LIAASPLIGSVGEISPAWLTALLQPRYRGASVLGCKVETVIGGTATKVRLLLEVDRAGRDLGLPASLWLKAGFEAGSQAEHLRAIYLGEALFYRDLAHRLDLCPPRAFASVVDEGAGRSCILLEDLVPMNVRFGHAAQPLSPRDATRGIELLAKLHARFWDGSGLDAFDWLQGGGALIRSGVHDLTYSPEIWARCAALPRGRLMTGPLADRQAMHGVMSRLLAHDLERAHCLVHGDAQPMNLYFTPDGTPGLIDWQTAMHGHWAHDVTEFIVAALDIDDRRAAERGLIEHYVATLRENGVESLGLDEAWREYARHTAYTFHWALCQPEWQPEAVCVVNAERACAAIADHDSLSAWQG
jgi:hypothetical protein